MKFYKSVRWRQKLGAAIQKHFLAPNTEVAAGEMNHIILLPYATNEHGEHYCGCFLIIESTAHGGEPFGAGNYCQYWLAVADPVDCSHPVVPVSPWEEVDPKEIIYHLLSGISHRGNLLKNPLILEEIAMSER